MNRLEQPLQGLQLAQLISNSEAERGIIIIGGKVQQIAEELCPTPPKFPWPWPRPHGLDAVELFAAGLTFQRAADSMLGLPYERSSPKAPTSCLRLESNDSSNRDKKCLVHPLNGSTQREAGSYSCPPVLPEVSSLLSERLMPACGAGLRPGPSLEARELRRASEGSPLAPDAWRKGASQAQEDRSGRRGTAVCQ
jgi:hypothetical protein